MKILYIWLQEYGTIKDQGFVTNSEYNIKGVFNSVEDHQGKDKFSLFIEKNENYIKDFFEIDQHSNSNVTISDITGIIGENGAGKSTFLNFIKNNLLDGAGGIQFPSVVILKDGENGVVYYHDSIELDLAGDKSFKKCPYGDEVDFNHLNECKNTSFIFYSNIFDYSKWEEEWGENYNISTNYFIKHDKKDGIEMKYYDNNYSEIEIFRHNEIKRQLDFINRYKDDNEFTRFKLPELVHISINPAILQRAIPKERGTLELNHNYCDFDDSDETKYNEAFPLIKYVYIELKKHKNEFMSKPTILRCDWYMVIFNSFFHNYISVINLEISLEEALVESGIIQDKDEKEYFASKDFVNMDIFHKVNTFFERMLVQYEKHNYSSITEMIRSSIKVIKFIEKAIDEGRYSWVYNTICLDTDNSELSIFNFIKLYDKTFLFKPYLNFDWNGLSSGQKAQLSMFSRFFCVANRDEDTGRLKDNIIVLIDEGELYYHPQWQKEYIKTMIFSLKEIYKRGSSERNREIQIILTSNSPFIASDLPTKNIILLKNENGNCRVIDGLQDNIYTFGANIHTLLSDSFFMNDGLIGSFAKQKIDSLVKILINDTDENLQNRRKEINSLIAMIGEPIIRNKLLQIFKDRMCGVTGDNIIYDKLIGRVEQLEKEIKELKMKKDE